MYCVINDPRSIPGKEDGTLDVMFVTRSSNVIFEEKYTSRGDYYRYDSRTISAKRNIKGGKELSIDYGADYKFEK